jgi:hypothetical protein
LLQVLTIVLEAQHTAGNVDDVPFEGQQQQAL